MDKKAKDILLKTYWSSAGWRDPISITPADLAYAKEKGVMFDPLTITHDECIEEIMALTQLITPEQVGRAFLASLSTRRLEWRSALASYHRARALVSHHYVPVVSGHFYQDGAIVHSSYTCQVCQSHGLLGQARYEQADLNVLNFERLKWGGVRHGDLLYTYFDLREFAKEVVDEPTEADLTLFRCILQAILSCQAGAYPGALRDKLKALTALPSNHNERTSLIEILACIEVLKPQALDRPVKGKHDWTYAASWRGEDGYDQTSVARYFGAYLP